MVEPINIKSCTHASIIMQSRTGYRSILKKSSKNPYRAIKLNFNSNTIFDFNTRI